LSRLFDLTLALVLVVLLSPILLSLMLLIWTEEGGPVLFSQSRIGRAGRRFKCHKLRTMSVDAEARLAEMLAKDDTARAEWQAGHKLRNDPRITRVGSLLRKTSLDELPQLFNVIRGEMSIVGPRPIVEDEIPRYGRRFNLYCSVKPGLTGLWQVTGRSDVSYRRRVAIDSVYCARKTLALDIRIVLATVPAVLSRRGSY
jgi:lipopolysaccharide/colanic/teichoic acid biosynthesis glycosyltransferase